MAGGQDSWVLGWTVALTPQDLMSGSGVYLESQASLTDSPPRCLPLQRCPVSKPNMGHQHQAQDPVTTWQVTP